MSDRVDYPLFVVCAEADGEPAGCLAGFVTQCSIDPERYLVCVSKANHTFGVAGEARGLSLHLLGAEQTELASRFGGQTGDLVDKFEDGRWRRGVTGAPVLDECAAWIEGAVIDRFDVGDHVAHVLEPVAGGSGSALGQLTLRQVRNLEPGHKA